ncbi:Calmodulin-binding protein 60 G [Raphanus sativus]|uniref:Calmodulin-binding protein 60 G n=1 Tax=Raphanus sativus TaxID=3726 RepID=A0A6J0KZ19_RAPSA|nr:calmodulin-binding protein 60 G [Raphanus sativus]KAJ4877653.1 Calmodulin-binding protein 60 G [Raphanus sativus]
MRNILNLHGSSGHNGLKARRFTFKNTVNKVIRDLPNHRLMVLMEPLVRKILREELDHRLSQRPYLPSSWSQTERSRFETPSSRSCLKLRFINSPPSCIFTGAKIETEDGSPVAIELVDAATNARVVSGPLSSSRVEIVPLKAQFTEESWTADVFKRYIEKQREAKRPLLTGDVTVRLENGVGVIAGDVSFSDNSSWTWSRKFRLGARLTGGGAVEARSEAFNCKDQRGESYRKHYPPYPSDEVWRLKKIAKGGVSANRLAEQKIYSVKDLRRWYAVYPNELYNILGRETNSGGISKKEWEAIVSHAMQCVLDERERYIYNGTANGESLIFNSVYEVIKVSLSDGTFWNPDELPTYQLDELKKEAYKNLNEFRTYVEHPQRSLQCTQNPGFGVVCPGLQHNNFQGTLDPSGSLSSLYFTAANSTIQPEMLMGFENSPDMAFHIDRNLLQRNSFRISEHDQDAQTLATRGGYIENEEEYHENTFTYHHGVSSNLPPGAADWEQQICNSLSVSVYGTEEAGTFNVRVTNSVGSPRARWCKVKAAFKIREVWKQAAARKRGKACLE